MLWSVSEVETAIAPLDVPFDYADGNGLMLVVEGSRNRDRPSCIVPFDYADGNGLMLVVEGSGNRDRPSCIVPFDYAQGTESAPCIPSTTLMGTAIAPL